MEGARPGSTQTAGCCLLLLLLMVTAVLTLLATQQNTHLFSVGKAWSSTNHVSHFVHSSVAAGVEYPGKTYKSFAVSGSQAYKSSCESDSLCASWVLGACFGGHGLQAHVCYLREATEDLSSATAKMDDCSAWGGRVTRAASEGAKVAVALPTSDKVVHAASSPGFATSYAEAGHEYKGTTYTSFPAIDAQRCKASCLSDARCSNWVLGLCTDGRGLQSHVCYLKTANGKPEHTKDACAAFGGSVYRSGPAIFHEHMHHVFHVPPVNYRSFATTSRIVCQSKCEADQRCGSWVHGLCAAGEEGAHECYLNTAAHPQWPRHDACARFGGSVIRSAADGDAKPTEVPSASPTTLPTDIVTDAPVMPHEPEEPEEPEPVVESIPAQHAGNQTCVSEKDATGKISVTCHTLVAHHVVPPPAPSHHIHITVHAPKVEVPPPPVPAPPQEVHLIVHVPTPPGAPPAPAPQNTINVATDELPKGKIEGADEHRRSVAIHIDPKTDVTSQQKVINVEMHAKNKQTPKLAAKPAQYNGLKDNGADTIVAPLANKGHHCQTTPTSNGNLIVTCTSVVA